MSFAEAVENVIEILNIFDIDPFLLITWRSVPPRFGPVPVVVPFEKGNIILTHKPVQKRKDEVLYVVSRQIEHQLISAFGTLPSWKAHDPVRMLAIEITIGIHHLRFHPQAEVHTKIMNPINYRLQAMRKLSRVGLPIPQSGVVGVSFTEPAIVDDESLNT